MKDHPEKFLKMAIAPSSIFSSWLLFWWQQKNIILGKPVRSYAVDIANGRVVRDYRKTNV